jgi:hypothetical protein
VRGLGSLAAGSGSGSNGSRSGAGSDPDPAEPEPESAPPEIAFTEASQVARQGARITLAA